MAAIILTGPSSATAQRVRFVSPVEQTAQYQSGAYGNSTPAPPAGGTPGTGYGAAPPTYSPGPSAYTPYTPAPSAAPNTLPASPTAPSLLTSPGAPPAPTYSPNAAGGGVAPPYAPQPGTVAAPSGVPGGAIQPPPTNWDPYAAPCGTPSALLPNDPYFQSSPNISMATMQKFIQHVDLDYHWFAGHGDHELGINDMGISVTCAFPMFFNTNTPLLVTPGFYVHLWDGPVSYPQLVPEDPWPADLPPRTYDAYIDAAWNPQVTPWFGAELNFRIGIYSDFNRVTSDSMRFMGKGMAVLNFSPNVRIKAGAWYLDRNQVKILPAGGICWTPNPDVYFDILFPNPEVGKRLTTWGNTDWWLYFAGDYGGGTWTIKRNSGLGIPTDGTYDRFDYNDIRISLGLRFETLRKFNGNFEIGFACSRELIYRNNLPKGFYPHNTVFIGGGVSY